MLSPLSYSSTPFPKPFVERRKFVAELTQRHSHCNEKIQFCSYIHLSYKQLKLTQFLAGYPIQRHME